MVAAFRRMGGAFVLGSLGPIALLLTLLATLVLAESMATLRMGEMGIRAALAATRREPARILMLETVRPRRHRRAAGLLLAWLGAGTIRTFLFRIQPFDPLTPATTAAALLVLACAVSLRPALRAARVDLATILKAE